MKKIGIVICNYNKKQYVLDCIQSVLESRFQDFDLYVVDNGSQDGSGKAIRETYPEQVTLICNQENLGGSGGFNTGLRIVHEKGYPYLMCVDNDVLMDENAIGNLYQFLEEHPEAGMAGAKVYHMEAPDYVQQFGQKIDFEYFCTEVNYYNAYEDGSMPEYLFTDSVAACALMVRRSIVDRIGIMPEENFLYWDDTEWCYRCNQAGYKVASVGNAVVLHAMGAKKEAVNTFPTYYAWRNWIRFFIKYTPESEWDRMAETFLGSVFQEVYEGLHKGEHHKVETIMLAYDDAIHNITGKAGENRIFPLDFRSEPWERLFRETKTICINRKEYPETAERICRIASELGYQIEWIDSDAQNLFAEKEICICDSIFRVDDLERKRVYVDVNDCILQTEDDVLDVINYNYSKRSFIYGQKPLFLQKIREMRKIPK